MKSIVYPIHVDALVLSTPKLVKDALADYSRLPFTNKTQDHLPDTPYLGEVILNHPFQDKNLVLPAGTHLHWVLPKALCKPKPDSEAYIAVPNIWIVRRIIEGKQEKYWLVESNYISKELDESVTFSPVTIPFHDDDHSNKTQPFRFMGQQMLSTKVPSDWNSARTQKEDYLTEITAVGYNPQKGTKGFAEPTFAAFYPNSSSVFGLYDAETIETSIDATYEVIGLYADLKTDYLRQFVQHFKDKDGFKEAFKQTFQGELVEDKDIDLNQLYHLTLFGKTKPRSAHQPDISQIKIAIGNTGTEALSAYLADQLEGDKKQLEELLESVQFSAKLQNKTLDIGAKFLEARHDKGFKAVEGGSLWQIKLEHTKTPTAATQNDTSVANLTLPIAIADLLNQVNLLQSSYEKEQRAIHHLRRQFFADWYKYMICAYPPIDSKMIFPDQDELVQYIQQANIAPLEEKIKALGQVQINKDEQGKLTACTYTGTSESIAAQLCNKLEELRNALENFNTSLQTASTKKLALRTVAAPRYWLPNDPVVLFAESFTEMATLQNPRYSDTELKTCYIIEGLDTTQYFNLEAAIKLRQQDAFNKIEDTGNSVGNAIWNPFMLEWEVAFSPSFAETGAKTEGSDYPSTHVQSHYQLAETALDFNIKDSYTEQRVHIYSGSTILSPYAAIHLDKSIEQFLQKNTSEEEQTTSSDSIIKTLRQAKTKVKQTHVLSQSLGGFHEALLMRHQTRQLDIADPLGFPEYQAFAEKVAPLIGKANQTAPMPLANFNPIRSGKLKVFQLRLIDAFGLTVDFKEPTIISSETFPETNNEIHLKPRLAQAARLNLRFISANSELEEMNTHSASSPVCGWLMPNHLDKSIMFYDQDGSSLGAFTPNKSHPWIPAPHANQVTFIDSITNPTLRKVARFLLDRQVENKPTETSSNFLTAFMEALDSAEQNIAPENFAEHQELAVLIGRPIAVLRVKINLELASPPATDQSWLQLQREIQGYGRSDKQFTKVKFPIRIGEYQQLNDGVIGYWLENQQGQLLSTYYSAEASPNDHPNIKTYQSGNEPMNILHAIADEPLYLTMLVNPRGAIHATTGILPVKSIALPKDQYQMALQRMNITFLTAPVLSKTHQLNISLPQEEGYEWAWLEKNADRSWELIPQTVLIDRSLLESRFPDQPDLWNKLATDKWIQVLEDNPQQAIVTTELHRNSSPTIDAPLNQRLDNFFATYGKHLGAFDAHVGFDGTQSLREGWLQLQAKTVHNS